MDSKCIRRKGNLEAIDFLKRFNEIVHRQHPGILTIAEESTAWTGVSRPTHLGGLGFSLKWNMGWMHDILEYFSKDPVYRKHHHGNLTFSLLYAFTENFMLVLSHDEVVHGKSSMLGKMPGDMWQKFANLRLLYGFMYGHPGKKLLLWEASSGSGMNGTLTTALTGTCFSMSLIKLRHYVRDLNRLYRTEPPLYEVDFSYSGFEWIDFHDTEQSVISFIRKGKRADDFLVVVCNFTPLPRYNYRIGVPESGLYKEILNSDSAEYWGSGIGNTEGILSENISWNGRPHSISITLPPLAVVVFKPDA